MINKIFEIAAVDLDCDPVELAAALEVRLTYLARTLAWGRDALVSLRDLAEENDFEWPGHTWDEHVGKAGIALNMLEKSLNFFPVEIKAVHPEDAKNVLLIKARDKIRNMKKPDSEAKALLIQINDILDD